MGTWSVSRIFLRARAAGRSLCDLAAAEDLGSENPAGRKAGSSKVEPASVGDSASEKEGGLSFCLFAVVGVSGVGERLKESPRANAEGGTLGADRWGPGFAMQLASGEGTFDEAD